MRTLSAMLIGFSQIATSTDVSSDSPDSKCLAALKNEVGYLSQRLNDLEHDCMLATFRLENSLGTQDDAELIAKYNRLLAKRKSVNTKKNKEFEKKRQRKLQKKKQ